MAPDPGSRSAGPAGDDPATGLIAAAAPPDTAGHGRRQFRAGGPACPLQPADGGRQHRQRQCSATGSRPSLAGCGRRHGAEPEGGPAPHRAPAAAPGRARPPRSGSAEPELALGSPAKGAGGGARRRRRAAAAARTRRLVAAAVAGVAAHSRAGTPRGRLRGGAGQPGRTWGLSPVPDPPAPAQPGRQPWPPGAGTGRGAPDPRSGSFDVRPSQQQPPRRSAGPERRWHDRCRRRWRGERQPRPAVAIPGGGVRPCRSPPAARCACYRKGMRWWFPGPRA